MNFEETGLWSRALAARDGDNFATQRERLRVVYKQFWGNAVLLANQIQKDVPGLTLHDETHFDALWSRADQIAGPSLELTPLEAFVLGGAILVHDAANTVAAFPGGVNEVRATPEWGDAEAEWIERRPTDQQAAPLTSGEENIILFDALRSVHAKRAETLCEMAVETSAGTFHLLPDDQLRVHLGRLIGKIAASHHWDIEKLPTRLNNLVGALAGFPADWAVRPVLLACLLRCADAIQLDQARTPDFLYGILKLKGLSEEHWRAQNRLAAPVVDPNDARSILFTSTMPFKVEDASAWWIAYDALKMANRELRSSEALLRDLDLPPFQIARIGNSEAPDRLAGNVATEGWCPVDAKIKINRVERVVEMFGGSQLYGRDPHVPLRELIQNAADAIRQRRSLEPTTSGYRGKIIVRLVAGSHDGEEGFWLNVDDDGLGMSEAVLTGPLIDFGSSYLSSQLVKSERPGLIALRQRRVGKYGIGFFSSFMITDNVDVTSRPFDGGLTDARTLQFRRGIGARPILLNTRPQDFDASLSTRVSLFLTQSSKDDFLQIKSSRASVANKPTDLASLTRAICPMVDADIFVGHDGEVVKVHDQNWHEGDRCDWLRSIAAHDGDVTDIREQGIARFAPNLAFIDPDNPHLGYAAIAPVAGVGIRTVGGLVSKKLFNAFDNDFFGAIEHFSSGPSREPGKPVAEELIAPWATKQAETLGAMELSAQEKFIAATRVSQFGGDATPIAIMNINRQPTSIDDIFERLESGREIWVPVKPSMGRRGGIEIGGVRSQQSGFMDNYRTDELEFLVDAMEPLNESGSSDFLAVPFGEAKAKNSFCDLLNSYASERGRTVDGQFFDDVEFAKYVGKPSEREGLATGKIIKTSGLRLFLRPAE